MKSDLSEPRLFTNDIDGADLKLPFGRVSLRLRCGPNREKGCEDAMVAIPLGDDGVVLAVADGVGGSPGGREAAAIVLEALRDGLASADEGELQQTIFAAIETANRQLIEQRRGSGTTVVIAEIRGRQLRSYHVGDSEIAIIGQRGKVKHRIVPHSPTGFAVESGLLTEDEAMHHDYRHILLNVVGAPNMRIEVAAPVELAKHDTVLLASDGLLDNLYVSEIFDEARCGALPATADKLVTLAFERMHSTDRTLPSKADDLSIILYRGTGAA